MNRLNVKDLCAYAGIHPDTYLRMDEKSNIVYPRFGGFTGKPTHPSEATIRAKRKPDTHTASCFRENESPEEYGEKLKPPNTAVTEHA